MFLSVPQSTRPKEIRAKQHQTPQHGNAAALGFNGLPAGVVVLVTVKPMLQLMQRLMLLYLVLIHSQTCCTCTTLCSWTSCTLMIEAGGDTAGLENGKEVFEDVEPDEDKGGFFK